MKNIWKGKEIILKTKKISNSFEIYVFGWLSWVFLWFRKEQALLFERPLYAIKTLLKFNFFCIQSDMRSTARWMFMIASMPPRIKFFHTRQINYKFPIELVIIIMMYPSTNKIGKIWNSLWSQINILSVMIFENDGNELKGI